MTVDIHHITDGLAYWVLFWSLVNILLPPREVFANSSDAAKRRYNTLLMLVAYYGSLNLRKVAVGLYSSVQVGDPSKANIPPASDQTQPIGPTQPIATTPVAPGK